MGCKSDLHPVHILPDCVAVGVCPFRAAASLSLCRMPSRAALVVPDVAGYSLHYAILTVIFPLFCILLRIFAPVKMWVRKRPFLFIGEHEGETAQCVPRVYVSCRNHCFINKL